jgi:hypothetical protein
MTHEQKTRLDIILDGLKKANAKRAAEFRFNAAMEAVIWEPPEENPVGFMLYQTDPKGNGVICSRDGEGKCPTCKGDQWTGGFRVPPPYASTRWAILATGEAADSEVSRDRQAERDAEALETLFKQYPITGEAKGPPMPRPAPPALPRPRPARPPEPPPAWAEPLIRKICD